MFKSFAIIPAAKKERVEYRLEKNVKEQMLTIFFYVFFIIFLTIWIGALFNLDGNILSGHPLVSFAAFLCYAVFLFWTSRLIERHDKYLERHCWKIVFGVAAAAFLAMVVFAYLFECRGRLEMLFVNEGAKFWALTGNLKNGPSLQWHNDIYFTYEECFMVYNNIYNTLLYLVGGYKFLLLIGVSTDHLRFAASVLVCFKTALAFPMLFYIVKKNRDVKAGLYAVILLLTCFPILVSAPIVYHYTISFTYPLVILLLYTIASHTTQKLVWWLSNIGIVLIAVLGYLIMKTPIIVMIAIIIEIVLLKKGCPQKRLFATAILAIALSLLCSAGITRYQRAHHFDDKYYDNMHLPPLTWVFVGMNEESCGIFDLQDQLFYWQFPSIAEKNAALSQAILDRLTKMGAVGTIKHLYRKTLVEFGTGTYYSDIPLRFDPVRQNELLRYFSDRSDEVKYYRCLTQGIHLAYLLLLTISAYARARKRRYDTTSVPWITLFGLLLVTLPNETSPRHIYCFIPIILYCAAMGMSDLQRYMESRGKSRHKSA